MLTPWKESYDQPGQHIKKQRHYFANKGPPSQGYGFSSGHVWMWELDHKESCCCYIASVVSDSVWPQRLQPTRLPCPWVSLGKNTRVGCHCLFQCMKVKSESEVAQLCPTLSDPMDCSTPGLPVHHQFPEFIQTHVYQVSDAIQPSSVILFSSHLQSFPASGSFPMSQFFASGGQSIGVSASASVLPTNIQSNSHIHTWPLEKP